MQFTTTDISQIDLEIVYANKLISEAYDTTLLAIYAVHSTLVWRIHPEEFAHK
jgi:hypothetical protein